MIHLPDDQVAQLADIHVPGKSRHHQLHQHAEAHGLTRRQFLQAGMALVGVTAGSAVLNRVGLAGHRGAGFPSQVTGFSPLIQQIFGVEVPFFLPIEVDPFVGAFDPVADPLTITDFNGFLGLIEADGVSDPNQNSDRVARTWSCDVRFMKGVFADRSGRKQRGAFGFF